MSHFYGNDISEFQLLELIKLMIFDDSFIEYLYKTDI